MMPSKFGLMYTPPRWCSYRQRNKVRMIAVRDSIETNFETMEYIFWLHPPRHYYRHGRMIYRWDGPVTKWFKLLRPIKIDL